MENTQPLLTLALLSLSSIAQASENKGVRKEFIEKSPPHSHLLLQIIDYYKAQSEKEVPTVKPAKK